MHENISPEKLTAAGYTQIARNVLVALDPCVVAMWRKEITDGLGVRYCISIEELIVNQLHDHASETWIKAQTHFRFTNGGYSTVTHSIDKQEIEDVEDYFEEIWTHMGFHHIEGGHDYEAMARAAGDA
ncbi:hypothetical protein G6L37_00200 [Agrobacterium rubi]|nr:hypothetical protein [Agrobacterium rubi]NTF23671.1 hypothetical protein [Agrobacterium rubi]